MTLSLKNLGTGFMGSPLASSRGTRPAQWLMLLFLINFYSFDHLAVIASPPKYAQSNSIFNPILPQLKQKTRIKIRLPKYIPGASGENRLYAIIETATRNKYEIILGFTRDCNGGNACSFGSVSAQAITEKTPRPSGKAVLLSQKIIGYFIAAQCGANCSDSTITWQQQGVQYTVGLKAGDRSSLIKMANSVQ